MKYKSNLTNPNGAHYKTVSRIPRGVAVLEFGCAQGYMTEYLASELGCTVWAVEIDRAAAQMASRFAHQVVVADLDTNTWEAELSCGKVDIILLSDVLEHLKNPGVLLAKCADFLAPGGKILLSLPNVSHRLVIAMLLLGEFTYSDVGLLDSTHLRFFTPSSFTKFVNDLGFVILDEDSVICHEPKGENLECLKVVQGRYPTLFDDLPHTGIYQFLYTLQYRSVES